MWGLSGCRLVGSCVLPGEDFFTLASMFARLTQSQAISQSFRVFISFRSMRDTFFETLFIQNYRFLYNSDQKIFWWTLQVAGSQLRNPPVEFRHERWLHLAIDQHPACQKRDRLELWPIDLLTSTCRSTQVKIASTDLWPQEMFTFSEMLALVESEIGKQFRCLRLS